jgi:CheY-like chemotaxis protein/anti-sigma regulatory factor (Ser/Thr protein kinase)
VGVIRRGGEHLLSLIEGTLDLARIEGGKVSLAIAPVPLPELLDELADMFALQARAKRLRFTADFGDGLPRAVRADERKLRQVLINVLGNAVKFTDRGEVRLRVRHEREIAQFDIEDTGPGIAPADLERVFEPFARGSVGLAGENPGTGLGLTIAKMLTELMGGEMTVRSTPGAGTAFRLRLFLPALSVAAPPPRPVVRRVGYRGERRRLLVVDNVEVDRELLRHLLVPLGFEVELASSGEDAIARVRAGARPDAILMDLAMPGIDGWETIRTLRGEGLSRAPVAIVSANAFDRRLDNDLGLDVDDYVLKPVRADDLLNWMGRALALEWCTDAAIAASVPAPGTSSPEAGPLPAAAALRALAEQVRLGYPRGIHRWLDHVDATEPACAAFTGRLRAMARQFRLDAMGAVLAEALREREAGRG